MNSVARRAGVGSPLRRGHCVAAVDDVLAVFEDVPSTDIPLRVGGGHAARRFVARVQLAPSRSEARRLVQSGGVYVNNRRVSDLQARVTSTRRSPGGCS